MPLFHKYHVFLCLMLCMAYAGRCHGETNPRVHPLKITADNDGHTATVNRAQILILTLNNNVDGGYHFDEVIYNKHLLKLIKHANMPPPAHSGLGNHGTDTWRFIAINKGRTALSLTASRPWKHGEKIKIFSGIIIIK